MNLIGIQVRAATCGNIVWRVWRDGKPKLGSWLGCPGIQSAIGWPGGCSMPKNKTKSPEGVRMLAKRPASQSLARRRNSSAHWVRGVETSDVPGSEIVFAIFQPDILIPDQFRATYERTVQLESEKILMLAVLRDAVACFQKNLWATEGRKHQLFLDANQWIMDENAGHFFSFDNICDFLGLDPGYIRHGLLNRKETALAARAAKSIAPGKSTGTNEYKRRPSVGALGRTTSDHEEKKCLLRYVGVS